VVPADPVSTSPSLRDRVDEWAAGKNWVIRLPLLLYFAWVFRNHVGNYFYTSFIDGLNLGIHELGHFLWSPLGQDWAIAGGSLTQCLVPLIAMWMFYRQHDLFAISIGFCWLATNLYGVGTYAADALTQQLTLVSPIGGDPQHDWGYLLARWGKMSKARQFGLAFRGAATVSMLIGLLSGAWILWRIRATTREATGASKAWGIRP